MKRLPADYFERIYAREEDPWGFDARWYEARKYALTLAALPRERYARAFEPGCANGALTERLAARCESLLAADLVPDVVARCRVRLAHRSHVEVDVMAIPDDWPTGRFDLVVLSEVVYYLHPEGVTDLLARLDRSLDQGGHVVAVHWRGETDYPMTAGDVHQRLDEHPHWNRLARYEEPSFLLSVHERAPR